MFNKNISLLQYITSNEVEDLIIEYDLEKKGYVFNYFIDNYDIGKYSFPMGLLPRSDYDNRSDLPIEIITDEQISYYYLINKEEHFLLFDEHIEELNNYIKKVNWVENNSNKSFDALEEFLNYFNEKNNQFITFEGLKEKFNLFESSNISLIITIALGALYDGKKKLVDLKKKLLFNQEETNEKIDNFDFINECRPSKISEHLFEKLIIQFRTKNINRIISRYNKCKVFERLVCINNKTKNKKQLYFLLSSSKSLSNRIPNIAKNLNYIIRVENKVLNPVRTISQIYLKLLLSNNENKLKYLKIIKEIISLKEQTENVKVKDEVDKYLLEFFEQRLTELREQFENASLLLSLNDYRKDMEKALSKSILQKNKTFITSLQNLLNKAKDKQEWEKIQSLSLSEIIYLREYSIILKDALIKVSKNEKYLSGFSGQDYIDSPFHNLPFVFINESNADFNKIINNIISLITESHTGKISSKSLLISIKDSFKLLFEKPMPETTDEEKIIMLLMLLMLRKDNELKPNMLAYSWINEIIDKQNYSKKRYIDFLYVKSWICRRITKYDEAIKIAKEGLTINNNDPRFYQSLALNYYCIYKDTNEINNLNLAINNSLTTLDKYKELLILNDNISIEKSIIAVLNSLAYQFALKYSKENNVSYLENSRHYLFKLKNACNEYYCDYIFSAEFQHTEAYIELQEFFEFNKKNKLCNALERIKKAIKLTKKTIYIELKEIIQKEIDENSISC